MKKLAIIFLSLAFSINLFAWEKESEIIKISDSQFCRVYKDWILKFELKNTIEEPKGGGGPGSQILIIKKSSLDKVTKTKCDIFKSGLQINFSELSFVGFSEGFVYLEKSKRAPGTEVLHVIDIHTGKEKMQLATSGKPFDVKGKKIIYWEQQQYVKGSRCKGHETAPGFGCFVTEKKELEVTTGKKINIGPIEIIPYQ